MFLKSYKIPKSTMCHPLMFLTCRVLLVRVCLCMCVCVLVNLSEYHITKVTVNVLFSTDNVISYQSLLYAD